jgi:sporulation protein YqfC
MGLMERIAIDLGLDEQLFLSGVKYIVFDGHSAYFEGIKGIKSFSEGEVQLYLKKGSITIEGDSLRIKKLCKGDVALLGNIKAVKRDI